MECEICHETKLESPQEHHWRYSPAIKSILCKKCHISQHKHGVGNGKVGKKAMSFIRYSLENNTDNLTTQDFSKFYLYSFVFTAIKKLRDLNIIVRKGYSQFPSCYTLNLNLAKKMLGLE